MTVHLYHWEPNANSGKPMLTLAEKGVPTDDPNEAALYERRSNCEV